MRRAQTVIWVLLVFCLLLASPARAGTFEQGMAAFGRGDYNQAISLLTRDIESGRNNQANLAVVYNNRGLAWMRLQVPDKALADFNQAIALRPNFALAFRNRGRLLADQRQMEAALADLTKAIELDPGSAVAYGLRGNVWHGLGDLDQAIADFGRAIKLKPNNHVFFNNRGGTFRDKGDLNRALADFNRAIKLNPNYGFAYFNRALVYKRLGDLTRATADAQHYAALAPNDPDGARLLKRIRRAQGDQAAAGPPPARPTPAAEGQAEKAMAAGLAALKQGLTDKAIGHYNAALLSGGLSGHQKAVCHLNRGYAWLLAKQPDKALADYNQAIAHDPELAMAYNNRGSLFDDQGRHPKAIADYNQAILLDPNRARVYLNRSITYEKMGRMDLAVRDTEKFMALAPADPRGPTRLAQLGKKKAPAGPAQALASPVAANPALDRSDPMVAGLAAYQDKDYDSAMELFSRALARPGNTPSVLATIYFHRSQALLRKRQLEKALADLTRAVTLNPRLAEALFLRGDLWHLKGQFAKAVADYDRAYEAGFRSWRLYNSRGNSWLRLKSPARALADYDRAIAKEPQAAQPYYNRAVVHQSMGQMEKARKDLARYVQMAPDDQKARQMLARLDKKLGGRSGAGQAAPPEAGDPFTAGQEALAQGRWGQAIEHFSRDIDSGNNSPPDLSVAYTHRGLAYLNKGEVYLALADFDQATRLSPDNPFPYYQRGILWIKRGRLEQAVEQLSRAVELKPDFARALADRGLCYLRLGRLAEALADCDRAIELEPRLVTTYYNRALIREKRGQYALALADARKFLELAPEDADGPALLQRLEVRLNR